MACQLVIPLRHYLYPGRADWTTEGYLFAWHMRLSRKVASARFLVRDPATGKTVQIAPEKVLPRWQANRMVGEVDMLLQFSHYLASIAHEMGFQQAEVQAQVLVSLNGRKPQYLLDPTVNLAAQSRSLKPAPWITRLTEPLRP
jgi:hypothetical protein